MSLHNGEGAPIAHYTAAEPIEMPVRHYTVSEIFPSPLRNVLGFVEKNYVKGLHLQEFYEINIVLSGHAVHTIGEASFTVGMGDTFIVPPSVLHAYRGGDGFDVYHVLISPKFLEKHSADLALLPAFNKLFRIDPLMREKTAAKPHFCLSADELDALMPTLTALSVSSHSESVESAIIAGCEALTLIARLCGIYGDRGAPTVDEFENDAAFLASIAYIYENFDKSFTIDTLCRIARMSRTAYIERFKRVTGYPPRRFLTQYRISVAKKLQSEGGQSAAKIAQAVGCYDTSHLTKMLSSYAGQDLAEISSEPKKTVSRGLEK
jgi:AraC-like DNA-binding protein